MRFSDTTARAILKMFVEGISIKMIASCYTTTSEAIEKMIQIQLRNEFRNISKEAKSG
jgi:hypothetical protein